MVSLWANQTTSKMVVTQSKCYEESIHMLLSQCVSFFFFLKYYYIFSREPSEAPKKVSRKRTKSMGEDVMTDWKSKKIMMGRYEKTQVMK